jgi:hypothetical protein
MIAENDAIESRPSDGFFGSLHDGTDDLHSTPLQTDSGRSGKEQARSSAAASQQEVGGMSRFLASGSAHAHVLAMKRGWNKAEIWERGDLEAMICKRKRCQIDPADVALAATPYLSVGLSGISTRARKSSTMLKTDCFLPKNPVGTLCMQK